MEGSRVKWKELKAQWQGGKRSGREWKGVEEQWKGVEGSERE